MPQTIPPVPTRARQLLPKECYFSDAWFEREHQELFSRSWTFACVVQDIPEAGDYKAVQINRYAMFIVRTRDGSIRAYHNTCRHRGTTIFEKDGNCRHGIVCPYHAWTYNVDDGSLRGLPKKDLAFPGLKMEELSLHKGTVGVLGDLIFVNPQELPQDDFEMWLGGMRDTHMWPHSLDGLSEKRPVRYDFGANWKAFCENAMDGYHLSYLHDKTLMGPDIEDQRWDAVGRHWVTFANPESDARMDSHFTRIPGVDTSKPYPVVYQFFPNSGVLSSPIFFSAYTIVPVGPEQCYLELRTWMMPREKQDPAKKPRQAIFDLGPRLHHGGRQTLHLDRHAVVPCHGNARLPDRRHVGVRTAAEGPALTHDGGRPHGRCRRNRTYLVPGQHSRFRSAGWAGHEDGGGVGRNPTRDSRRDAEAQRNKERSDQRIGSHRDTEKNVLICKVFVPDDDHAPRGFAVCYRAAMRPNQPSSPACMITFGASSRHFCASV